jgi:hypothetical protein
MEHLARMRFATLLLTLAFALGALAPCRFARSEAAGMRGAAHARAHVASHAGAPPCHDAPAAVVKAPCPCGCDKRAPGVSLGSLGVALLACASDLPPQRRSGRVFDALPAAFASPPPPALEKVPRAA